MSLRVSIITPCFNGVSTILDCINSVRNQGYENIEHIIVDGGSTDGTLRLLEEVGANYTSGSDSGIYDAINKGIDRANGDIIGILNCDDYYSSNNVIDSVIECFSSQECDLVHGRLEQVDDAGRKVWTVGKNVTHTQLLKKMRVAHPSVYVKKEIYRQYGKFSVGFRIAGDYDFVLRVFGKCKVSFVDMVMVKMRMNGVSNTQSRMSMQESMAVQLLHGVHPLWALLNYYKSIVVHEFVLKLRVFGVRR